MENAFKHALTSPQLIPGGPEVDDQVNLRPNQLSYPLGLLFNMVSNVDAELVLETLLSWLIKL